jgi:hypothetical protein
VKDDNKQEVGGKDEKEGRKVTVVYARTKGTLIS